MALEYFIDMLALGHGLIGKKYKLTLYKLTYA